MEQCIGPTKVTESALQAHASQEQEEKPIECASSVRCQAFSSKWTYATTARIVVGQTLGIKQKSYSSMSFFVCFCAARSALLLHSEYIGQNLALGFRCAWLCEIEMNATAMLTVSLDIISFLGLFSCRDAVRWRVCAF